MLDLTFKQIAPDTYQKWNSALGVRTTIRFNREARKIHVRHDQPKALINAVLERNVAMQNESKRSFKDDLITQTTSMPIAIHKQVMAQCGFQEGHGYDEKKFRQIINDRDNYKLKTVSGRI